MGDRVKPFEKFMVDGSVGWLLVVEGRFSAQLKHKLNNKPCKKEFSQPIEMLILGEF